MFKTLKQIVRENWAMRAQIWHLAVVDIQKNVRGAVLGWFWLFVKPIVYISVFWFALELGLQGSRTVGDYPFLYWLAVGLIPWFFLSSALVGGANVYKTYPYLVNRVQFPLSVISTFYILSAFIIFIVSFVVMLVIALIFRVPVTIYWLQIPVLIVLMFLLAVFWSIMASPLAALSKDFRELLKALSLPLFWLSGTIFNIENINIPGISTVLHLNPVAFFASSFRAALCDQYWVWEKPEIVWPFLVVFLIIFLLALRNYSSLSKVVSDVV
jgi:teichoic acid transport system permease protein